MVQVIRTERTHEPLSDMLGMSLGKGIGNGISTYFANKSLEGVLNDKELEGAPQSKKLQALQTALAPYGEKGQEIFQQRMQIEQQEMQEKETVKQEKLQKEKGKVLGKYLEGEKLTPDEQSLFTPKEFVDMYKAKNPQAKGGVTAQPVPADVSQKISEIMNQSQGMSADELKNVMDSVGIAPIYSNGYIENRRRSMESGTEHDIKFHQESSEFEKLVRNNANVARRQLPLIEKGIKAVEEGKIKPSSMANVFSFFGEPGKKISNALLSGDEAALMATIPEFLEGRKEIFGVRLSDADLRLLQDKLPDIGKNKEANLAIFNLMKRAAERSIKLEKTAEDVLEKKGIPFRSGKLRPVGYEKEVMNAFDEFERSKDSFQEVPPAAKYPGKIIEDDSGRRYRSNGTNWEPI